MKCCVTQEDWESRCRGVACCALPFRGGTPALRNSIMGRGPMIHHPVLLALKALFLILIIVALVILRGYLTPAQFKIALRPSGIALVEGKRVPVVTDGEFIPKGASVEIAAARGSRVVVCAVPGSADEKRKRD